MDTPGTAGLDIPSICMEEDGEAMRDVVTGASGEKDIPEGRRSEPDPQLSPPARLVVFGSFDLATPNGFWSPPLVPTTVLVSPTNKSPSMKKALKENKRKYIKSYSVHLKDCSHPDT